MAKFGQYLGSTLEKLNRVAGEVSGTVHNVAFNLEQTFRDNLRGSESEQPLPSASRRSGSTASSAASTPDSAPDFTTSLPVTADPSQTDPAAMLCDECHTKFGLFQRRVQCPECRCYFCKACIPPKLPSRNRTCARCHILQGRPPNRTELMQLRVKDLKHYLSSKRINSESCVEKKELVELIVQENSLGHSRRSHSGSVRQSPGSTGNPGPIERQTSFPKSYTNGSHRPDWMSEFDDAPEIVEHESDSSSDPVDDFVVISSPSEEAGQSDRQETPVELFNPPPPTRSRSGSRPSSVEDPASHSSEAGAEAAPLQGSREPVVSSPHQPEGAQALLQPNVIDNVSNSSPSSSRRFANRGLVYLADIERLEDLQELSVKQIKEVLALNRVTFKGVLEKEELLSILSRLWKQEQKLKTEKDTMEDDDLCKICMDNPVDCVMLECGHMCTCTQCGKQMAECPICRQYVIRVVRIFKS